MCIVVNINVLYMLTSGVPHCGVTPHDVMNILSLYQNTMYHVYRLVCA